MHDLRLGDVIDDYCVKCRRLTNHSIVSLVSGAAAKVRCRTCYSDHDYRNETAPPTKKELARQKELYNAVLAGVAPGATADGALDPPVVEMPATDSAASSAMGAGAGDPPAEVAAAEIIETPAAAAPKKKKK